jgi:hypothetical protein
VLREFVVNLLGTEDGADEALRRAWARLEEMKLPRGTDAKTMLITLAESEVWRELRQKAPKPVPMPATSNGSPTDPQSRPGHGRHIGGSADLGISPP